MSDIKTVCFTGDGITPSGRFIHRFGWKNMAQACDLTVHGSVYANTDILVASRDDTTKARAAAAKGTKVISYLEFLDLYARMKKPKAERTEERIRGSSAGEGVVRTNASLAKLFDGSDPSSIPL